MKKLFYLAIVAAALTATSCATVFCGSKKTITLDSNIPVESAKLTIDGHKYNNVSFPYVVKVKRGFNETIVKAEAEGYTPTTLVIDKTFNPVSVLNILGMVWWAVDAATGAMMKPEYNYYELEFTTPQPAENRQM
ncbi:hypothetical protein IMSAGC022_01287 [Alistipes sp.]|jgi:hypothetical protein|nr:hypothetical protein IMSAGC022_01287 [Alistipes sp.]